MRQIGTILLLIGVLLTSALQSQTLCVEEARQSSDLHTNTTVEVSDAQYTLMNTTAPTQWGFVINEGLSTVQLGFKEDAAIQPYMLSATLEISKWEYNYTLNQFVTTTETKMVDIEYNPKGEIKSKHL